DPLEGTTRIVQCRTSGRDIGSACMRTPVLRETEAPVHSRHGLPSHIAELVAAQTIPIVETLCNHHGEGVYPSVTAAV
ncbi:MAG TPA: hypothetical protein VMB52_01815, partial [Verrucomicrobiae bacterium]|nr:hypothetical protein [Verrucomicrobiae bacterium]